MFLKLLALQQQIHTGADLQISGIWMGVKSAINFPESCQGICQPLECQKCAGLSKNSKNLISEDAAGSARVAQSLDLQMRDMQSRQACWWHIKVMELVAQGDDIHNPVQQH